MTTTLQLRGRQNHAAGLAAETRVEDFYGRLGARKVATRWRGKSGEIDLIFREGATYIFVEVKSSKTFDGAMAALSQRQMGRIMATAEEFCATLPSGSLTDMRFDVALLDRAGGLKIIEGAVFL